MVLPQLHAPAAAATGSAGYGREEQERKHEGRKERREERRKKEKEEAEEKEKEKKGIREREKE